MPLSVVLVVWFALANSQRVEIDFLVGGRESRLVYVIVGSAVLGAPAERLLRWRRPPGDEVGIAALRPERDATARLPSSFVAHAPSS